MTDPTKPEALIAESRILADLWRSGKCDSEGRTGHDIINRLCDALQVSRAECERLNESRKTLADALYAARTELEAGRCALGDFATGPFEGPICNGINAISMRCGAAEKELKAASAECERLKTEMDLANGEGDYLRKNRNEWRDMYVSLEEERNTAHATIARLEKELAEAHKAGTLLERNWIKSDKLATRVERDLVEVRDRLEMNRELPMSEAIDEYNAFLEKCQNDAQAMTNKALDRAEQAERRAERMLDIIKHLLGGPLHLAFNSATNPERAEYYEKEINDAREAIATDSGGEVSNG